MLFAEVSQQAPTALAAMKDNIVSNLCTVREMGHLDILVLVIYFGAMLIVGFFTMRRSGKNAKEFFLSGQSMPWWLLGFSLVATTFAADTPNLVTGLVREQGVSGNWSWWAFLLTGMTTVFIYAKLWRRLGVMTDIEFYEIRYGGKSAAFLRGFRTLYLGFIVNTIIMANVILAIIKILGVMLGIDPITAVIFSCGVTVLFSAVGGLSAVIWADFILFIVAMAGAIGAAVVAVRLPEVGGLAGLFSNPDVLSKVSVLPNFSNTEAVIMLLVIPLAVQWWSTWYPGAEPGGGSYSTQRMFAAKNEKHAVGATLFFNFCHYAVRPWPWIIVALASIIVYPTIDSLKVAFPNLPESMINHDMAYPAMLTHLPSGLFGLVLASLFAAFMSTIATHLNLGSSYIVNDFYHRFVNPNASQKQLVFHGRIWTVLIMILACVIALHMRDAVDNFKIILEIGAGTGLLFLLRWFWWRINAWSEISAMVFALSTAIFFRFIYPMIPSAPALPEWLTLLLGVAITTVGWIIVTFLTPPTDQKTLVAFLGRTRTGGLGWRRVINRAEEEGTEIDSSCRKTSLPMGILCSVIGCVAVYASLFAVGDWIYGHYLKATILSVVAIAGGLLLIATWSSVTDK